MIVVTADQVGSRSGTDLVAETLAKLNRPSRYRLVLPAERLAGDELQAATGHGQDALDIILNLTRTGGWSVGCGVGAARMPLGDSIRAASGPAFIAARDAVERAKRRQTKFALTEEPLTPETDGLQAMIDLVLALRGDRSDAGWQLYDLVAAGSTQADAASVLGVTPQAVSKRARSAGLRLEDAAIPPLAERLDAAGRRYDSEDEAS